MSLQNELNLIDFAHVSTLFFGINNKILKSKSVLAYKSKKYLLEIKESLLIMRDKPSLNRNINSAPFYLFDKVS